MGSGKTTVGRLVARRLGWPVSDSDAWILDHEGATAREVRAAHGTEALHELERRHLREGLASPSPSVICAAAATIDDGGCRAAMAAPDVLVAWLLVTPAVGASRFEHEGHRPRYGDDPETFLARQLAARGGHFRAVADLELAADAADPDALADRIADRVRSGP